MYERKVLGLAELYMESMLAVGEDLMVIRMFQNTADNDHGSCNKYRSGVWCLVSLSLFEDSKRRLHWCLSCWLQCIARISSDSVRLSYQSNHPLLLWDLRHSSSMLSLCSLCTSDFNSLNRPLSTAFPGGCFLFCEQLVSKSDLLSDVSVNPWLLDLIPGDGPWWYVPYHQVMDIVFESWSSGVKICY